MTLRISEAAVCCTSDSERWTRVSASSRLHDSSCCFRSAGGLRCRSTRVFAFVLLERSLRPCVWLFAPNNTPPHIDWPRLSWHRHRKHNTTRLACRGHSLGTNGRRAVAGPAVCGDRTGTDHDGWRRRRSLCPALGNQVQISSHRKLLLSKAAVVNIAETSGQDLTGKGGRGEPLSVSDTLIVGGTVNLCVSTLGHAYWAVCRRTRPGDGRFMFVALISDSELSFLALVACLVCGVAIGWVARDCLHYRWTAPETPNGQERIASRTDPQ
jgi:hypothetical protein